MTPGSDQVRGAEDQPAAGEVRLTGAEDNDEVAADAAVVTVPIGVLKAEKVEFDPPLPARTRTAIDGLGAGLLDKVWLAFEEPFWDENAEGFSWIDPGDRDAGVPG